MQDKDQIEDSQVAHDIHMTEAANRDQIKAVRRIITKVLTKGTCSGSADFALQDCDKEEEQDQKRVDLFESR